jgi:dTDP-4-dehydrorhamnose 3,5-epimerase
MVERGKELMKIGQFAFEITRIPGVILFKCFCYFDERGTLIKDYSRDEFIDNGIDFLPSETYFQIRKKGTLAGNRLQVKNPQVRIFSVLEGEVYDVVTDLRSDSPTYKQWQSFRLSSENGYGLLVPKGCSNGSLCISDSIISIKSQEIHDVSIPNGFLWCDETICIEWPVDEIGGSEGLAISKSDLELPLFRQIENML